MWGNYLSLHCWLNLYYRGTQFVLNLFFFNLEHKQLGEKMLSPQAGLGGGLGVGNWLTF